jgi:hypothetical protein
MRKTIAAISASILGVGGALAASAAPASAAPLPDCDNATDHVVNPSVDPLDAWYMTCIPQYGMGKVEFTITTDAAHPFPAGYALNDGHQTVTSTPTSATVENYFQPLWNVDNSAFADTFTGAFMNLTETSSTGDHLSQTYGGGNGGSLEQTTMAFIIQSVGKAASLPADCTSDPSDPTYQGEYEVTYKPTTTTFTETIDSVVHKVTVTYTPAPLFLGLNFDTSGDGNDQDGFDTSKPICSSSGGITNFASSQADDGIAWFGAAYLAATNTASFMTTLDPLAEYNGVAIAPTIGPFAVTSTPTLATTGVDPGPAGAAGIGVLVLGIIATLVGVVRRRKRMPLAPR